MQIDLQYIPTLAKHDLAEQVHEDNQYIIQRKTCFSGFKIPLIVTKYSVTSYYAIICKANHNLNAAFTTLREAMDWIQS